MTGLRFTLDRGDRVQFTRHRDERGTVQTHESWSGVVLDKGPNGPEWWVMPSGGKRAVVCRTADLTPVDTMHRG